jgi:hypothetical protein
MAQPAKKPKRVPLGKPIDWTDEDMADMADVHLGDLKAAEALWERDAPTKYRSLLRASVLKGEKKQ